MLATTTTKCSNKSLDCIPKIELIVKRFKESDLSIKLQLLNKLRELAMPKSTPLIEPEMKTRTQGRPQLKVDTST